MTDSFYYFMVTNEKDIFGGPHYGTQYDLSAACPVCGSGAVRQPPIYTKKLARSFDLYMTLDYDILFSDKLVAAFRDEEIDTFDDVISCKTKEILPYKVLRSQAELPRFSENQKDSKERIRVRNVIRTDIFISRMFHCNCIIEM